MVSRRQLILRILILIVIGVNYGSSEFNSSQQYKQLSNSGGSPVVRNVDISSSNTFGNRYVGGGKYRSSYYYPKTMVATTTTPIPNPSPHPSSGPSSSSSPNSPVWVVWGRQGTPYDGYSSPSSSDYYQYEVDNNNDKYYNDKYYNDKYYNYLYEDPHSESSSSIFSTIKKHKKKNFVRTVESDEEEEAENNSIDEDGQMDRLSVAQLKGLMKTRRTGGSEILGGILSLKGLKLGAIGLFYLFRGVMILLWKFLPWIFLAMVALLFVPVPILTIPAAAGRQGGASNFLNVNMTQLSNSMTNSTYSLIGKLTDSEQCVERISCEIRRQSRDTWFHSTIKMFIYQYESQLPQSIQRMAKAYVQHRKCKHYNCFLFDLKNYKKM